MADVLAEPCLPPGRDSFSDKTRPPPCARESVAKQKLFCRNRERASPVNDAEEQRKLRLDNKRLKQELESVREVFARHIANTETQCEKATREKDAECVRWYKSQKIETDKMHAAHSIMSAFFQRKQRCMQAEMQKNRLDFDLRKQEYHAAIVRIEADRVEENKRLQEEIARMETANAAAIEKLQEELFEAKARGEHLEDQLSKSEAENKCLREERVRNLREIDQLTVSLVEAQQSDELQRRGQIIELLEAELKQTKKDMLEQARLETEALEKELMDHVKFIVNALPEEGHQQQSPRRQQGSPRRSCTDSSKSKVGIPVETFDRGFKVELPPLNSSTRKMPPLYRSLRGTCGRAAGTWHAG